MISFIRGLVADTTENAVILENNGIGYEIFMTGSSIEQVSRIDGEVKIHTYFQVREDAMQLYGFLSKDDLEMFRLLLNVNGIGPKAALGVLAGLTADELRFAVLSDDIHHVDRDHDRNAELCQLCRQIQVSLKVRTVDDVQDRVRTFTDQVVSCNDFF